VGGSLLLQGTLAMGTIRVPIQLEARSSRVAVVGPSGIGKSTLLQAVVGLARLGGAVRLGEHTWEGPGVFVPPWSRGVGYVPQDPTLFPHKTVRENLDWSAPATDEILEMLGITALLPRWPRHLSGGERQRVALGRGMAAARTLLVLDEPFSALDRPRREEISSRLRSWCDRRALPLLLVSHDGQDVSALADEVFVLGEAGLTRR
jgi:molybdate transport system ATP-binding protein